MRARNACQCSADAAGIYPVHPQLAPSGGPELRATLPVHHIVDRLRTLRIPAYASRDAGAYLCNAVLWRSLEAAREASAPPRVGFIHIPASLGSGGAPVRGRTGACPLTWEQARIGGLEIIAAALGRMRVRS